MEMHYLILTGLCDLWLGYACRGSFRWTDPAPWLGHLVLFLYISVLRDMRMCCPINRRPLAGYIALASCPHHLLSHAEHSGSAGSCIPTGRGEFGAGTRRGWASKSWRFRHSVQLQVWLERIQSSGFISHSLGIPFQIAQVEYPELCSTGVQILPGISPYSTENELQRLGITLPPSLSSLFLPVLLCLYSPNESRRVQVKEPDGGRDGGGGGTRGKGLITTFPKRSLQRSEVYACASQDDWQGDKRR